MTPSRLGEVLGEVPVPRGSWERGALYVSAVAARVPSPPGMAESLAVRLRGVPGVTGVRVRPNGFLEIAVAVPGELVAEILADPPRAPGREPAPGWADAPRTWDNPGFVVRFAHERAGAAIRWAGDLGVPGDGFAPGALGGVHDLAVLRVLAELPSRLARGEVGWASYLGRLAAAYHDAHERASAVPMGDEAIAPVHTARVWLARAVRVVLAEGLAAVGEIASDRV